MERELLIEELYREHADKIFRKLLRMGCGVEDAEDIMQSAYLKAFEKIDQLKDKEVFVSWFTKIAIRMAYKKAQKDRQLIQVEITEATENILSQREWENFVIENENSMRMSLQEALQQIPECFRIPLCLFAVEKYKYEEIAELLGIKGGTVKSRIYRARAMLKELMPTEKEESTV